MIDRDEFLHFRIDNYLEEKRVRVQRVNVGLRKIALRSCSDEGITIGAFADSRREFKGKARHHFIETSLGDTSAKRQLWLPAVRWANRYEVLSRREIVTTEAHPDERFAAWQDEVLPIAYDTKDYEYSSDKEQALYEEAMLTLQFLGANDDRFSVKIEES